MWVRRGGLSYWRSHLVHGGSPRHRVGGKTKSKTGVRQKNMRELHLEQRGGGAKYSTGAAALDKQITSAGVEFSSCDQAASKIISW